MTMTYDLSNRMTAVSHPDGTEEYVYAPDNRRVWRSAGKTGCGAAVDNSGQLASSSVGESVREHLILYSPGGQKMGVYCVNFSDNMQYYAVSASEENVMFGGRVVAKRILAQAFGSGLVVDFTADRLLSKGNGSNYYPYEESKTATAGDDREGFATYTRDEKSGLDYADQRWYASGVGRFTRPDPLTTSFVPQNPITANRYAYVDSDPANGYDPSGLLLEGPGGSSSRYYDTCYIDGEDYCGGNEDYGLGGGGAAPQTAQELAEAYGVVSQGATLSASSVNWDLLLTSVGIAMEAFDNGHPFQSAHLTILQHVATVGPNSLVPAAIAIPILIQIGEGAIGVGIHVAGGTITVGLLWQLLQEVFLKPDIKQNRDAARAVAKEPGCRKPDPVDFDKVHEITKDQKGPDGKVKVEVLLEAWREVLCSKK